MAICKSILKNSIYQAEKMPDEYKDKISEDDAKAIKDAAAEAKKVLSDESADKDAYEAGLKALNDVLMPIGAKLYQNTTTDANAGPDDKSANTDDGDAVEGEVVE